MKNNNWKKRIITLLIFVLGGVLFGLNNNVYAEEVSVSDFDDFKSNLETGKSVILAKDIDFTEAIELTKEGDYSIELNGHNLKCSSSATGVDGTSGAMIKISQAKVNLTITNKGAEAGFINDGKDGSRAIYINVTSSADNQISIENTIFKGFNVAGLNTSITAKQGGAIYYYTSTKNNVENKSKLTINNCKFINNEATDGGAIFFNSSASPPKIEINNTSFEYNKAYCHYVNEFGAGYGRGGALYFDYGLEVTLKDNTFSSNETILKTDDSAADAKGYFNSYSSGGAIYNVRNALDLEGNKFTNNKAYKDGGAIFHLINSNVSKSLTISNSDNNQALFDNNSAKRGGAVFIYEANNDLTHGIEIEEGIFSNNSASEDGGAINYTQGTRGYLKLKNALITGNTAVVGGGIWLCPSGKLETYSTLGGAIYGNTATGSFDRDSNIHVDARGNEIRYSVKDADDAFSTGGSNETHYVTISPRNHEGKLIDWYADGVAHRYQSGDSPVNISDYKNRTTEFSLTRTDNDYFEDADVIFINNTAGKRGGAIATNWTLIIGEPEDMDITVNKEFVKDGQPYNDPNKIADNLKIYINLYRIDANGKRVLLDKNVELNKDNEFKYTFTDLPTKYNDENGDVQNYSYEVKEVDEKNQVSNTCTSLNSEKRTCTITNEYVAPPVEFVPSVEKKVTGKTKPKKAASFTFEISSEEQDGVELPKNTKVTVNGEGRVNFGNIKITKAGEYNFTIKEVIGNNLDYKYDLSVWVVKVVVGENTENGTLYIDSIKYYKKNKEYEKVIFENEYNPSTGDPLLSNVSNLIISGFIILGISMIKRKIYN